MLFKNLRPLPSTTGRLERVVVGPDGTVMPFEKWQAMKKAETEAEARQAKMPGSESYDMSFRSPISATRAAGYDFSQ